MKKSYRLSKEEREFLSMHAIDPEELFDGHGMSRSYCINQMRDIGADFCISHRNCQNGHRLKSRAQHCIQCRTQAIGFMRREKQTNYIYLAFSEHRSIIKVGITSDVYEREHTLNKSEFEGANDWIIVCHFIQKEAVALERQIHEVLNYGKHVIFYNAKKPFIYSREVFPYEVIPMATMLMMHYGKSNINGHVIGDNGEIDTGNFPKIVRKKWVKWLSEWKDYISNN